MKMVIDGPQGRNHRENLGATTPMVGKICTLPPPPSWNRVKVSENLGATPVAPVAPVDTSLRSIMFPMMMLLSWMQKRLDFVNGLNLLWHYFLKLVTYEHFTTSFSIFHQSG